MAGNQTHASAVIAWGEESMNSFSGCPKNVVALLLSLTAVAIGCREQQADGPVAKPSPAPTAASAAAPVQSSEASRAEAQEIFATRCTPCHGSTGGGDGPASAGLTPPPRNFHDRAWQSAVTDEHIEQIIQYGGAAVGKSPAMPSNPDLTSKPEVVAALRQYVRNLGK
jgi:mono/diheme cytochrome c family protein